MMKFIRKNGRIIPIHEKDYGSSHHGKFAVAGALSGAMIRAGSKTSTVRINTSAMKFSYKTAIPGRNPLTKIGGLIGLGAFGASIFNSYHHAKKERGFFTRAITNYAAFSTGKLFGQVAMNSSLKKIKNLTNKPPKKYTGDFVEASLSGARKQIGY